MSTTKTHTQKTTEYQGTDLVEGMTWVDGYGSHYVIERIMLAQSLFNGYVSADYSYRNLVLRLTGVPAPRPSDFIVTIDNSDLFDILDED